MAWEGREVGLVSWELVINKTDGKLVFKVVHDTYSINTRCRAKVGGGRRIEYYRVENKMGSCSSRESVITGI